MAVVDELAEFLDVVKDLLSTADRVAFELQKKGMHKESAQLYKSVGKLEQYLNSDGNQES